MHPGNTGSIKITPGWYIDDVRIGETYVSDGTMVIEIYNHLKIMMKSHQTVMVYYFWMLSNQQIQN